MAAQIIVIAVSFVLTIINLLIPGRYLARVNGEKIVGADNEEELESEINDALTVGGNQVEYGEINKFLFYFLRTAWVLSIASLFLI